VVILFASILFHIQKERLQITEFHTTGGEKRKFTNIAKRISGMVLTIAFIKLAL
jgi:hypothetical protein